MNLGKKAYEIEYIDTRLANAPELLRDAVYHKLSSSLSCFDELVIICIGSDRSTGDSLGPITGYKLTETPIPSFPDAWTSYSPGERSSPSIYGTLDSPVHAKNLAQTMQNIQLRHPNPLIVAVDASLGRIEHIGCITIGFGAINPGAGLYKQLPPVGDIFITGIVNLSGSMEFVLLQNTRLALVMKMADVITWGLLSALRKLSDNSSLSPAAMPGPHQ